MKTMDLQVEEGNFDGFDGAELYFQTWTKPSPKAVILGIHGLGEHSDSYNLLAEGLNETPYQLIMSDLRGHGRSAGKRGVGSIDEFVLDNKLFYQVVRSRFPQLPLFFLGHSMGGLVLAKLLIRHGDFGAVGAFFSSPLMGVAVEVPFIKKKSASLLAALTPNMTLYNELPITSLTHYKKVIEKDENDHLRHDRISPRLYLDMLGSVEYCLANADKIRCPVLVQQAGDDKVVSQKKGEEFYNRLTTADKELIVYEGFYHEIYNEIWRDKPYADLKKWLDKHLVSAGESRRNANA